MGCLDKLLSRLWREGAFIGEVPIFATVKAGVVRGRLSLWSCKLFNIVCIFMVLISLSNLLSPVVIGLQSLLREPQLLGLFWALPIEPEVHGCAGWRWCLWHGFLSI